MQWLLTMLHSIIRLLREALSAAYHRTVGNTLSPVPQQAKAASIPYSSADTDDIVKMLVKNHFDKVYPQARITDLRIDYANALDEQEKLLTDGAYIERGARGLTNLPNIESVVLCGGKGRHAATRFEESYAPYSVAPQTWIQRHFPSFGLHAVDLHLAPRNSINFLLAVLRMLNLSQSPITHLVRCPRA